MRSHVVAFAAIALSFLSLVSPRTAAAEATIGKPAPAFSLQDSKGKTVKLSDYAGKTVVLEWFNAECPFVKKHYGPKSMQDSQKAVVDGGGAWLTINSSAEGRPGFMTPAAAEAAVTAMGIKSTAFLLDPEGTVGKEYGAKTTPHMFVIDSKGVLAYAGAIDDKPSTDSADIATSKNYVLAAVNALKAGKSVETPVTEAYGCGVKYK